LEGFVVDVMPMEESILGFLNRWYVEGYRGDGRTSTDFEDIVFVLENRRSVWQEMKVADETVRAFAQATICL
jgi:hypothetical protein